jgi:hypothetical protein
VPPGRSPFFFIVAAMCAGIWMDQSRSQRQHPKTPARRGAFLIRAGPLLSDWATRGRLGHVLSDREAAQFLEAAQYTLTVLEAAQ